jgi:imidazolonepropionase-like amidohydrolase
MTADHPTAVGLQAVRAGRLVDAEAGEVLLDRTIVVRDGRVEAILPPGSDLPDAARVVDLAGHTVLPGLIDGHSHLVGDLDYRDVPAVGMTASREVLVGVRNARATLRAGFTTVRDLGTFRAFLDLELRDAIDDGLIEGPRMQAAGAYVTAPGGGGEVSGLAGIEVPPEMRVGLVRTPDEVRRVVGLLCDRGADIIKVIATGAVLTQGTEPGRIELDGPLLEAAVETAGALGRFVAAHAHGTAGIKLAARAGVRSIEHGSLIDDEGIALLAERGTFLVADIYDGDWIAAEGARSGWPAETMRKNEEITEAQRVGFRKAVAAGVRIAYGTDSGVYPHGLNAIQLPYMVRFGMTPLGAIQAATIVAAEMMGWADRVGSLGVGRHADLVAVPGDPLAAADGSGLESLMRPAFVMKGGAVVLDERGVSGRSPG